MKYAEKHPMIYLVIGVIGISLSSIFVRYSQAPSAVTALWRLLWTVLLMTPMVLGKQSVRQEMKQADKKSLLLSAMSGMFLAIHFAVWFESLAHTTVASSTTIVCTEVIWVALGFCLVLKGKLSVKAVVAIAISFAGSVLIAWSDSGIGGSHLYGDLLALAAAVAAAVYVLLGRVVRQWLSNSVYTYVVYGTCLLCLLLMCLAQGYRVFDYGFSPVVVGLLLAVFSTLLGHSVFSWSLKYFTPAFVSASKLCEPVVAAILAGFLFGEVPVWLQVMGSVLILGGVLWYSRLESKA